MSLITGPNSQPESNKPGSQPKIIVDSDWKSQAQAEKERLNAAAEAKAQTKAEGAGGRDPNEPIGIQDLVSLLVNQALMYMGGVADPRTGKVVVAMEYAKVYIDLLGVVEEKTKGNLNAEEQALVSRVAHELRLEYVEIGNAIAQAVKEGKIQPGGGDGGGMKLSTGGGGSGGASGPRLAGPGL